MAVTGWLKSHSHKFRAPGRQPDTSKPGLENVSNTLTGRLVALRFLEAHQTIVALTLAKWRGDQPGIPAQWW